jgi:hypothetical protein
VLAAVDHRRRTGKGQHLGLSHAEYSLHFMAPALLDAEVNDTTVDGRGNRDDERAPHGRDHLAELAAADAFTDAGRITAAERVAAERVAAERLGADGAAAPG